MKLEVWMVEGTDLFRAAAVCGCMERVIGRPANGRSVAEAIGNYYLRNRADMNIVPVWGDTGESLLPFRNVFEREDGTPTSSGDDTLPIPADDEIDRIQRRREELTEVPAR